MLAPSTKTYDVVIAGAGPVGLFLACELRHAGCSVVVLEKASDPHSPLKELPFGVRGLSVATAETFDRRDLLEAIKDRAIGRETPAAAHWMRQPRRPGGHFAGFQFFHDQVDATAWPFRLPGAIGNIAADMASIEAVLAARAHILGVVIRRGCGVEAFEQLEQGVVVDAGGETFHGGWLVGCDGGRSTVRKLAGFSFIGTEPEFTGYSVQVRLANPALIKPGRHHTETGMYTYSVPGTIAMVDFDGGAAHRSVPITRDHVEAVLRRVSGTDVTLTALDHAATWTDRACQATEYRQGRVLLAGDAAHIHSPLGGQGLNLGLGDAMNLGWKLAAEIKGEAPAGLLDSYRAERHPVGAQVLDWSRAQVALMRPSPGSRALGAIIAELLETSDGATYFAGRVWGVGIRYDLAVDHPLAGRSVPDFELADGSRLNEHLRSGRGVLLDFEGSAAMRALADRLRPRVRYLASEAKDRMGLRAIMVRPDGIVGWACDHDADAEDAARAAAQWLGVCEPALE